MSACGDATNGQEPVGWSNCLFAMMSLFPTRNEGRTALAMVKKLDQDT